MKRQIVSAALGLWALAALPAVAQSQDAVVVELYTSQGCSSCPPADALLATLTQQPGVIPLALHVDYWDYIGWKDKFAHPGFTDRQRAYAKAEGAKMIYTPQMIIGGVDRVVGHEPAVVAQAIMRQAAKAKPVHLTVEKQGDVLSIRLQADPPLTSGSFVQLVRYMPVSEVEIEAGENAGHKIEYRNIVTSWQKIGDWAGQAPAEMVASAPGKDRVVVIVQQSGPGEILAAALVE